MPVHYKTMPPCECIKAPTMTHNALRMTAQQRKRNGNLLANKLWNAKNYYQADWTTWFLVKTLQPANLSISGWLSPDITTLFMMTACRWGFRWVRHQMKESQGPLQELPWNYPPTCLKSHVAKRHSGRLEKVKYTW